MTRDSVVQIATTAENKRRLEDRAEEVDQSLSKYGHELIEDHLNESEAATQSAIRQEMSDSLSDLRADLMEMLAEFRSETAPAIHDMQSVRTAYLIAIWKLLEAEYSVEERRYAMRFAAANVGIDPELITTDPSPDLEETDEIATETLVPALASVLDNSDDQ